MFRLEQKLVRRRLVGELLDALGQVGVAGKITRHGLRLKTVEKKEPRKTVVRGVASLGYTFATNANQVNIGIIPDSIDSQNANLLILVPAGRTEDTVSFLLGPSAVR
jgi:hypothetical protein